MGQFTRGYPISQRHFPYKTLESWWIWAPWVEPFGGTAILGYCALPSRSADWPKGFGTFMVPRSRIGLKMGKTIFWNTNWDNNFLGKTIFLGKHFFWETHLVKKNMVISIGIKKWTIGNSLWNFWQCAKWIITMLVDKPSIDEQLSRASLSYQRVLHCFWREFESLTG